MATPLTHSFSNDGVIQLGPVSSDSDAMLEVVEISDACFVHFLLQYAVLKIHYLTWKVGYWFRDMVRLGSVADFRV